MGRASVFTARRGGDCEQNSAAGGTRTQAEWGGGRHRGGVRQKIGGRQPAIGEDCSVSPSSLSLSIIALPLWLFFPGPGHLASRARKATRAIGQGQGETQTKAYNKTKGDKQKAASRCFFLTCSCWSGLGVSTVEGWSWRVTFSKKNAVHTAPALYE